MSNLSEAITIRELDNVLLIRFGATPAGEERVIFMLLSKCVYFILSMIQLWLI